MGRHRHTFKDGQFFWGFPTFYRFRPVAAFTVIPGHLPELPGLCGLFGSMGGAKQTVVNAGMETIIS